MGQTRLHALEVCGSSSFDRRNRRLRWARHGLRAGCRKLELVYVAFITGPQMLGTGGTLMWVEKSDRDRGHPRSPVSPYFGWVRESMYRTSWW